MHVILFFSPEYLVYKALPAEGVLMKDLDNFLTEKVGKAAAKVGKGHAMKHKWVTRDKASGLVTPNVSQNYTL